MTTTMEAPNELQQVERRNEELADEIETKRAALEQARSALANGTGSMEAVRDLQGALDALQSAQQDIGRRRGALQAQRAEDVQQAREAARLEQLRASGLQASDLVDEFVEKAGQLEELVRRLSTAIETHNRRHREMKGARLSGREQPDVTWQQHEIRWVRLYRALQQQFGIRVR